MRTVLLAALQIMLFIAVPLSAKASAATLNGVVLDENGSSIEEADVLVWLGNNLIASGSTGPDGRFEVDVEEEARYAVYVFADDGSTPGVDYLPSRAEVESQDGGDLRFTLVSAASLVFEGDIQFVESEELPLSVVYVVKDPASDGAMNIGGLSLRYGAAPDVSSSFLGLEPSHLVVPAAVPFGVEVDCSILVGGRSVTRSFEVEGPGGFLLERGERVAVDVRRFSVPFNLGVVEALHGRVGSEIGDMEMSRFYLAAERGEAASAFRRLSEARYLYDEGRYIESFSAARMSYLALRQTLAGLEGMYRGAALSVYILISLLSLTSTAIAFLLSNRDSTKLLSCPIIYVVSLAVLYLTYPGSGIIPAELFAASAALALAASLMVAWVLPRFLRGRGGDGHLPVRNIVVPIFSIAKRGIRRRRMRFVLTLTSLTVLVMSFVALTSFSEGYGLIVSRVSGRGPRVTGVLLRAPGYTGTEPAFITQTDIESGWLERQPESVVVSPKAENLPLPWAVATLNGKPIHGLVGIDPASESAIIDLADTITEGGLPSEGGILISENLRREHGVQVGHSLALNGITVTLSGVFDDEAFRGLKDLDGSDYLPRRLVDITPEETPTLVATACEPSEIVVTPISTALRIPFVGVSRVDIAVGEGDDVNAFAGRLALERGYLAWSSSPDGVYFARLGGYLEGKGLPLMVPWAIVILNVVVTMLNSMYERRREIHILSSVGLNPAQISAIFVAEASILGVAAGGAGYLAGLVLYRAMAFFELALEVHQKISAFWSLASIGIAMTAVIMGAIAALRGSVIITPSLMRRWRFEEERETFNEPWEISVPVKLLPEEVEAFFDFFVRALRAREGDPVRRASSIRVSTEAEGASKRVDFVYRDTETGQFYTRNALTVERRADGEVAVRLRTYSDKVWAHIAGTMVRLIAIEWSAMRGGSEGHLGS